MAIVKMSVFQLTFFASERDAVLQRLQTFDKVHIVEQGEPPDESIHALSLTKEHNALQSELSRLEEAIETLRPYVPVPVHWTEKLGNALPRVKTNGEIPVEEILDEIHNEKEAMHRAAEKSKANAEKKQELSHWSALDVSKEQLSAMRSIQAMVGTIPQRWADDVRKYVVSEAKGTAIEFLDGDAKVYYVLVLTNGKDEGLSAVLRDASFQPFPLEDGGTIVEQLRELDRDTMAQQKIIADGKVHLKQLCEKWLTSLEVAYEERAEQRSLLAAEDRLLYSKMLSFMKGYVPTEEVEAFTQAVAGDMDPARYMLTVSPADVNDPEVPILLKNNAIAKPFENIVKTYSLPLYKEMDPTGLIAPWYILFFSIMLGDLGYGALLFLGTTIALRFFHWKPNTAMSLRFFQVLSVPTMLVGLCFGSLFGGLIPIPALVLDPMQDFMTMIVASVALGFVHLLVGLALKGVQLMREGNPKAVVYDVFSWMFILVGLLMVALTTILKGNPLFKTVGFVMAIVGAVLILLFSARDEKGIGRFTWGLYNLYGATSYIGDLVSYTRLTAIMLAGAYIGYAMNMIGGMLTGLGIPGFVVAAVIIIGAHLFNLFLSSLSSYVHAMRLIYVEFFGKFFEGGGKPFRGMRPEPKYVELQSPRER